MLALEFLENSERTLRSLSLDVEGLSPVGLVLGQGSQGAEVAIPIIAIKACNKCSAKSIQRP